LDVSGDTALKELSCGGNKLTSLDLSGDTVLTDLDCANNQLTSLDVSDNPALKNLYCENNPMTYVKLPDRDFYKELSPVTYTVRVAEGSSKILFTALPQGFDKDKIEGLITGADLEADGFKWDQSTNPIKFQYKLCENPKEIVYAKLSLAILEVVGPVDPNKTPNPNPDKYWTVTFESEDTSKGTVAAENTFYVLKTAGKTLADLKDKAPVTASKAGYEFDKWDPALNENTSIDKDITVKAYFKQVGTKFIPLRINLGKANVIKTIKLKVKLVIGSKEMIKSIDGIEERITMDVAPFIKNGRTML
ncbi:hypothetical protein HMPREF3189_01368, partial [Clostridiales bacterium KA00134]